MTTDSPALPTRRPCRALTIALGALALAAPLPAAADTVVMKDGRIIYGTIIENTPRRIKIRTVIANIVSEVDLPRYQVQEFTVEESTRIDQTRDGKSAEPAPDGEAAVDPDDAATGEAAAPAPPAVTKREGVPLVLEVPLEGTFGEDIYPKSVAVALEWAVANGVSDVVFRIDSPGGQVWAAERIVDIMERHADALTYHALVERGISASIWPTFACRTIVMPPGATLGGAVVFSINSTGEAEVDKKMNSIIAAEMSSRAEKNGHDPAVVRAMILADSELYAWRDKRHPGPWRLTDTRAVAFEDARYREVEEVDTRASVLTLTADKAVWLGVARPCDDRSLDAFGRAASFTEYDDAGGYGGDASEQWSQTCALLRKEIDLTISSVLSDFARANGSNIPISVRMAALNSAKRELAELQRLIERAEDLEMDDVLTEYDTLDHEHMIEQINKDLADLRRIRQGG